MGHFKNPEHPAIRVQKLNSLELRTSVLETTSDQLVFDGGTIATGGSGQIVDAYDATGAPDPDYLIEGGSA